MSYDRTSKQTDKQILLLYINIDYLNKFLFSYLCPTSSINIKTTMNSLLCLIYMHYIDTWWLLLNILCTHCFNNLNTRNRGSPKKMPSIINIRWKFVQTKMCKSVVKNEYYFLTEFEGFH